MSTVIKLENIGKQYRLGTVGSQTLRGDLQRWWYNLRGKDDPSLKIGQTNQLNKKSSINNSQSDYVWALKDINLEVKQGEILGIIGKNGAGKSTLLKLLSRVTGPTTGNIKVKGRIASLLEVGTGFHPELTGRENIVEFAGVAKYIDTPVKRYSSGMYVRLGFAVAAHLEPDILIVDEVLAVGDAEFQKKAIGKMQDVSKGGGRTVLFVSHNMNSIQKLCNKAIMLRNGKIEITGNVKQTIEKYLASEKEQYSEVDVKSITRIGGYGELIKIINIEILNIDNQVTHNLLFTESYKIKVTVEAYKNIDNIDLSIRIDSEMNIPISSIVSSDSNKITNFKKGETKEFLVDLNHFLLTPGNYSLVVTVKSGRVALDRLENIIKFEVSNLTYKNNKAHNELWGFVQIYPKWMIKNI